MICAVNRVPIRTLDLCMHCRYAELDKDVKNSMSHRAVALGHLKTYLIDNAEEISARMQQAKKVRAQ